MKKVIVAALLLLVGSFGCGRNFEWLPPYENRTGHDTFRGYSSVFVSSAITATPNTSRPVALAVGANTIYASDNTNNRILKYDASTGAYLGTFGGTGTGDKQFTSPRGIAFDGTNLYVADFPNVSNNGLGRIQVFTAADSFVTSFKDVGGGNPLKQVYGLAVSKRTDLYLYVTENDTGKVRQININNPSDPQFAREWGQVGTGLGSFTTPHALAVQGSGTVFIADTGNNRLQESTPDGSSTFLFGGDGPVISPEGIAFYNNQVFVADNGKGRVAIYDAVTTNFKTEFGSAGAGKGKFTVGPVGIAVDSTGAVYVSDMEGRIQKFVPRPNL